MQTNTLASPCGVVELRQYTMQPGQRDTLIDIFERHFIAAQEAVGMTIVGQFRDRARADRFVFLRGFPDMASRHTSLEEFYNGEVWAEQRDAANATMIDWHDVLLLRPARPDTGFEVRVSDRAALGETALAGGRATVFAGIHGLRAPADAATVELFEHKALRVLRAHGVRLDALLVTEPSPNTYTRLPIREGEHVLVWVGTRAADATRETGEMRDAGQPATAARETRDDGEAAASPRATAARELSTALAAVGDLTALAREHEPLVVLELEPTSRSLLGHQRARSVTQTRAIAQNLRR